MIDTGFDARAFKEDARKLAAIEQHIIEAI